MLQPCRMDSAPRMHILTYEHIASRVALPLTYADHDLARLPCRTANAALVCARSVRARAAPTLATASPNVSNICSRRASGAACASKVLSGLMHGNRWCSGGALLAQSAYVTHHHGLMRSSR